MPIYEYRCCSCGHCFEVKQRFNDTSLVCCPKCRGESRKVLKPVPIIYKGSGFYSTDHRPTHWKSEESGEKTADKPTTKAEDKAEVKGK